MINELSPKALQFPTVTRILMNKIGGGTRRAELIDNCGTCRCHKQIRPSFIQYLKVRCRYNDESTRLTYWKINYLHVVVTSFISLSGATKHLHHQNELDLSYPRKRFRLLVCQPKNCLLPFSHVMFAKLLIEWLVVMKDASHYFWLDHALWPGWLAATTVSSILNAFSNTARVQQFKHTSMIQGLIWAL